MRSAGARVVRLRGKATQEEVVHESGVALRKLQNLETGKLNPRYLTLKSVARGLNVSLSKLLSGL